ncbi:hypothetical protein PR048_001793 [Dryococelus australis]|uniref:Uncharacterized protein n=1 Tax=Dryococelus australis TaxID=614101 RepID=A0ABQ9IIA4_9NEOP|nr:hypothetical protein PR048_001793 [Dryococelus australis]
MSKKTRMLVHPYINARLLNGAFVTSFMELREDENTFFNFFRMSVKSFDELVVKLEDGIKSEDTKLRFAITPAEMLAITLRVGNGFGVEVTGRVVNEFLGVDGWHVVECDC